MSNKTGRAFAAGLLAFALGCTSESGGQQAEALSATKPKAPVAVVATDGAKKAAVAPLGRPKFALKNSTPSTMGAGSKAADRVAEAKRLIAGWHNLALRHADNLALATTPEEIETANLRAPSARALRPFAVLIADLAAAESEDEPALDSLVFLCKYVGNEEVSGAIATVPVETDDGKTVAFDPLALLLEHHTDNPKIVEALRRLPRGDDTDEFLLAVFEKTYSPAVRWSAGAQLISSLRRNDRLAEMEEVVVEMSEDRYLEGVPVGHGVNARDWALNKLREIHTLGVGQTLPEVSGEKLTGGTESISDYRGKVVILDIWTTWCGPCVQMIPHQTELVERLKDKPFAILSVSCDSEKETLEGFLEKREMPWNHWWVAPDSEFKKTLNIASYPTIFILDGNGVIRHKNLREEELDDAIDALIDEIE